VQQQRPHLTLGGIPIRVEWSFWLIAILLGYGARSGWLLVAWVAIVLVSILVHEMGHAVALRIFKKKPWIVIHGFGGLTYSAGGYRSKTQSIIVSAAGPLTAMLLLGVPAYVYLQSFTPLDQFFDYDKYVVVHDIAWVNIAWSIVNLLPILPLDGGNIAQTLAGRKNARIISMVVAVAAATYFFQQQNQFAGMFLMLFGVMNFASYQQEKTGNQASLPTLPVPAPRGPRSVPAPVPDRPTGTDLFSVGAQSIVDGRVREGVDTMAAAYAAKPNGPTSLVPAQRVAQAGMAGTLAAKLLAPNGAGAQAAANLQAHLHYADCFREAAEVGELVYVDGRVSRAQTAFDVACSRSRAGEGERALDWLDKAIDAGFTAGALLDGQPDLSGVRGLPRWSQVRARVGSN